MTDKFAVFILTHGRPHNQKTVEALRKAGYTGKYYLVVDNMDETLEQYANEYSEHIIIFDKMRFVRETDTGLQTPYINFAVFARNAIELIAPCLGYDFFGMFDDDILKFRYRYLEDDQLYSADVKDMDKVFEYYVDFMREADLACTCFGSSTNYIGGKKNAKLVTPESNSLRLCFNSYIRNSNYKVDWKTNMCEDRITSILSNVSGQVWQQLLFVQNDIAPLYGEIDGGNSSVYRSLDEFTKVFFPVVTCPSSNSICEWKNRLITRVSEDNLFCRIISGRYKK